MESINQLHIVQYCSLCICMHDILTQEAAKGKLKNTHGVTFGNEEFCQIGSILKRDKHHMRSTKWTATCSHIRGVINEDYTNFGTEVRNGRELEPWRITDRFNSPKWL